MGRVRTGALALVVAAAVAAAANAANSIVLRSGGVSVKAPAGWDLVPVADPATVTDPRTVLVAGTEGATPRRSDCQVAAYRVPADGAVVVVLRWTGKAPEWLASDREVLSELKLRRSYFECFDGRGAAAQIAIKGRAYQVNLMVGDRAATKTIAAALATARSVDASK